MRARQAGICVFGICLGLLAAGEGWSASRKSAFSQSQRTYLRSEERIAYRGPHGRIHENIYRVQDFYSNGQPLGEPREEKKRYYITAHK